MKIIKTKTSLRNYSIFIRKNIINDASDIIKNNFTDAEKLVLITNNTIADLYGDKLNHYAREQTLIMRS